MKKITVMVSVLLVLLTAAIWKADKSEPCWLCTEESGIKHPLEYLHVLAEEEPGKAGSYLGKPVSFVAPFASAENDIRLPYYGQIERIVKLSVPDGRSFWVESKRENAECYRPGELLKVSGRITGLSPSRILLLNVEGTPGWPNEIRIEKVR